MSALDQIAITFPGGRRVDATVGSHVVHTDQPAENGGADTAPSPFDLFLASLGTCAGIFVQGFCAHRGIAFEGICIRERLVYGADGVLTGVDLELELPDTFPAKYAGAIVKVVEQCSVKRAIQGHLEFRVTVGQPLLRAV